MRYVEQNGGDPESPSEWICAGCGAEGPMFKYFLKVLTMVRQAKLG